MNKEYKEFKKYINDTMKSISTKINDDEIRLINLIVNEFNKICEENKELKEDLKFVLEQVLGAFVQNWCIDWNFNDIRKKYNISDKYDWNSDVDE